MPYRFTPWMDIVRELFGTLIGLLILWLQPISVYINLVIVLIGIDLFTGVYASYKEGQKITARKMGKTLEKFLFYTIAIIAAYILQRIANDGDLLPRIVALYIGAIELKSIFENIKRITGNGMFDMLWTVIKDKIDGYVVKTKVEK